MPAPRHLVVMIYHGLSMYIFYLKWQGAGIKTEVGLEGSIFSVT